MLYYYFDADNFVGVNKIARLVRYPAVADVT